MWWNGTSPFELTRNSIRTETKTWSELPNEGNPTLKAINNSKRAGLWVMQVGKLT